MGSQEAIGRHSHGLLPHGKSRPTCRPRIDAVAIMIGHDQASGGGPHRFFAPLGLRSDLSTINFKGLHNYKNYPSFWMSR
jgi:hypothetical protein